jgi:predicted small secreted protein
MSLAVSAIGCNTVRGAGSDLKGAANATERAITGNSQQPQQQPQPQQ